MHTMEMEMEINNFTQANNFYKIKGRISGK